MLVRAERAGELSPQVGARATCLIDEPELVDQFQIGHARGGADGMGSVGPTVADGAELIGTPHEDLPDPVANNHPRKRRVRGGHALRDGDQIRPDAVVIGAEHRAEAPECGNHLVGHQQDVVPGEHGLDPLPIALRRGHDSTGSQDGLGDERGHRVRPFGQDHLFQLFSAILRELLLAHRPVRAAKIVRRLGVQNRRARQVECLVEELEPGQRARHDA